VSVRKKGKVKPPLDKNQRRTEEKKTLNQSLTRLDLKPGVFEDGFGVKKSALKGNLHVAHDDKVFINVG